MAKAVWNGVVLAQSEHFEIVEGNVYFPPDSVDRRYLRDSDHHTHCGWKGTASYYDVVVDGQVNKDAAWFYPTIKPAAAQVGGFVAFWRGVAVSR